MAEPTELLIHTLWPSQNPNILQLYSFPTPNGVKVSIALEELELPYEPHTVKLSQTQTPEFLSLNPNNKIPAIIDPDGPRGEPLALWESGAILIYLAEKTGKLLPEHPGERAHAIQWLMFQMGGVGPMFGQYGYFSKFAGSEIEDPRPRERFRLEARRLMNVLEQQLQQNAFLAGATYSIADIATWPWIRAADVFYGAAEAFGFDAYPAVMEWRQRCEERPASQRGLLIPDRDA
ncbi:MAG: glutathione S-transferase N-terminal domain-containing protein [Gammaproteobacteria bacterium]|nr:glutathione S-transferase N-terminal domain-containing protein [Gammaproteobacteria bacterium]